MRRLRRFLALPGADQRRLLALIPRIAGVRMALLIFPFSALSRWAAKPVTGSPALPPAEWAQLVRQAASVVPGATCLTQALVLQQVLHGQGSPCSIRLGVRQGDAGFAAHAWVTHEGQVILGGPDVSAYAELHA